MCNEGEKGAKGHRGLIGGHELHNWYFLTPLQAYRVFLGNLVLLVKKAIRDRSVPQDLPDRQASKVRLEETAFRVRYCF